MVRLACILLIAPFVGCGPEAPAGQGLTFEPLPADGRPPPGVEAMLFGGSRGCRDDADCESGMCTYGRLCMGLVTADELWRVERIGERVRARLELQPELRPLVTSLLASVVTREEMGLSFRGRAVRALGQLVGPEGANADAVLAELRRLIVVSPASVAEVAAITLARLGDATGLDIVLALTEDRREASACEALRVLGLGARHGEATRVEALTTLLAAMSPDVDLELQRAAIAGLGALGDRRAIRPLAAHLATGPESLADEVADTLRAITGAAIGPDPLRWDAWVAANGPPEPPPYTLRGHDSLDDIDLPTP